VKSRGPGVRTYLLTAMMALAVVSVGITGLLVRAGVDSELTESDTALSAGLQACILRAVVESAIVSGGLALLVALPIALHLARPLRRLNMLARGAARGETGTATAGVGGGREIAELGMTLERLAATLRRQDELRRATTADVTHELRGALAGIVGGIEAVQDGILEPEDGLRRLAVDARRLGVIVDDVERIVEAQRPGLLMRKHPVDLATIVRERVAAHAHRFAAASLELAHAVDPACVDGDPERLGQVLDNLLSNALRYTDSGGRVIVCVRQTEHEAVVEVADSGIGIAQEHLARVFDRFWRVPDARWRAVEGSGVGLAVVRDLVLAHHGRVEVFSRLARGSRFVVRLPLASPQLRDGRVSGARASGPARHARKPDPEVRPHAAHA
jgi:two-component system sensor histidine kinase BaeS